jgi:hypothetical protein
MSLYLFFYLRIYYIAINVVIGKICVVFIMDPAIYEIKKLKLKFENKTK